MQLQSAFCKQSRMFEIWKNVAIDTIYKFANCLGLLVHTIFNISLISGTDGLGDDLPRS